LSFKTSLNISKLLFKGYIDASANRPKFQNPFQRSSSMSLVTYIV